MPTSEVLGQAGTEVFAGTYSTNFLPALQFTISEPLVGIDCSPGYRCRGDIDVNAPAWIDLEFGGGPDDVEINVIRLDKVIDPKSPGKLIDPPRDLAAWVTALPGTAKLASPRTVEIGGLPALQLDVAKPGDLQFGPVPGSDETTHAGIGPSGVRVIFVYVHAQLVVITEWLGPVNTERDPAAALDWLQPLVDSLTWS